MLKRKLTFLSKYPLRFKASETHFSFSTKRGKRHYNSNSSNQQQQQQQQQDKTGGLFSLQIAGIPLGVWVFLSGTAAFIFNYKPIREQVSREWKEIKESPLFVSLGMNKDSEKSNTRDLEAMSEEKEPRHNESESDINQDHVEHSKKNITNSSDDTTLTAIDNSKNDNQNAYNNTSISNDDRNTVVLAQHENKQHDSPIVDESSENNMKDDSQVLETNEEVKEKIIIKEVIPESLVQKRVEEELEKRLNALQQQYENQLKEQQNTHHEELNSKLKEQKQNFEQILNDELLNQETLFNEYVSNLHKSLEKKLEKERENHSVEMSLALRNQEHKQAAKYFEENMERIKKLQELTNRVYSIQYISDETWEYIHDAERTSKLLMALTSLKAVSKTNAPFLPEIETLKRISDLDELVTTVIESIPEDMSKSGVKTLSTLQQQFEQVKNEALYVSFAPTGSGLFGHLFSRALMVFVFPEKGFVVGDSVNAKLARAQFYLQNHKLQEALREVESIEGEARTILSDWIKDARDRMTLEQAVNVLEGHAVNKLEKYF